MLVSNQRALFSSKSPLQVRDVLSCKTVTFQQCMWGWRTPAKILKYVMWVARPAAGQHGIAKPTKDENKARITTATTDTDNRPFVSSTQRLKTYAPSCHFTQSKALLLLAGKILVTFAIFAIFAAISGPLLASSFPKSWILLNFCSCNFCDICKGCF